MNERPALSIVTTTDPLARQLPLLLEALAAVSTEQGQCYEVVVVDDLAQWREVGSPEHRDFPSLLVKEIRPEQRLGQPGALERGFQEAQAPLILTIDPDLYPCVTEIPRMMEMLNAHVLAVHVVRGSRPGVSVLRRAGSSIVNFLVQRITGLNVRDIGSPVTLFDRRVLAMIPPAPAHRQINLRLRAYLMLGDRLTCFHLKTETRDANPSHYNLARLIQATWRLLRDALYLRSNKF